uniref:Uncharacterized protein n=1 Tax=Panagrellus redivivus TaxID=6233 RepID=A0A7E4V310_PANRE
MKIKSKLTNKTVIRRTFCIISFRINIAKDRICGGQCRQKHGDEDDRLRGHGWSGTGMPLMSCGSFPFIFMPEDMQILM